MNTDNRKYVAQLLDETRRRIEHMEGQSALVGILHSVEGAYLLRHEQVLFDVIIPFSKAELQMIRASRNEGNPPASK